MPRLVEGLSRFFGRVEILALGLEGTRQAAELALSRGRALDARDHARTILAELPDSVLGLALWADAAEDAWLDHEVVNALSELSKRVPWRADVWLRLGRAGLRVDWPHAREALERAAAAPDEREDARLALFELCDLDLGAGDPQRAARWLEGVPATLAGTDRELMLRKAECSLLLGDLEGARAAEAMLGDGGEHETGKNGRVALVHAQVAAFGGDIHKAVGQALRAYVLDTRGAEELLTTLVASCKDGELLDRIRRVVKGAGALLEPAWAAAFALSEGRLADARAALARGLSGGDPRAAASLLRLAIEARDMDALHALFARDPALLPAELQTLREASLLCAQGRDADALQKLDSVAGDASLWASEMRVSIVGAWVPKALAGTVPAEGARWTELLQELARTAKALDRLDSLSAVEALAVERERPLRVAVVGEFNAGKSTFLNALLGEDVAPTGVLPTTATLHWVAWAPDAFARIMLSGSPDRLVTHEALKPTLRALAAEGSKVDRVFIYAPLERLKRVEILDTPGFNAPDPDHRMRARQAFDEAHVAIWLLDATGPMKESERVVLAEIKSLGVPVQILVNKADRLSQADLQTVLTHIRESLEATGIASHAPPVAFSARLSLKGRLGDESALSASGWEAVEALFAERIVDESSLLKERALRRRALRIAEDLLSLTSTKAAEDRMAVQAARERTDLLRSAAARLQRNKMTMLSSIERALEGARKHLASDLKPLADVAEGQQKTADTAIRAYVEERFVTRLSDALSQEIAKASGMPNVPASAARAVRGVLMGAAAMHTGPADLIEKSLERVIAAAMEAFAAGLLSEAQDSPLSAPWAALEQRVAAVAQALRGTATNN